MADAGTRLEQSSLEPKASSTSFGTVFAVDWRREFDLLEGEDGSDVDVEGENLLVLDDEDAGLELFLSTLDSREYGSLPLMVLKTFFLNAANMLAW
jgi:hypothetical protein